MPPGVQRVELLDVRWAIPRVPVARASQARCRGQLRDPWARWRRDDPAAGAPGWLVGQTPHPAAAFSRRALNRRGLRDARPRHRQKSVPMSLSLWDEAPGGLLCSSGYSPARRRHVGRRRRCSPGSPALRGRTPSRAARLGPGRGVRLSRIGRPSGACALRRGRPTPGSSVAGSSSTGQLRQPSWKRHASTPGRRSRSSREAQRDRSQTGHHTCSTSRSVAYIVP